VVKAWQVAREELIFNLGQWSFVISTLLMVVVFAAAGAAPRLRSAAEESPLADMETIFVVETVVTTPTGLVDYSGLVRELPAEQSLFAFEDEAAAQAALNAGEIEGYYVIAADFMESGAVTQVSADPQLLVATDGAVRQLIVNNLIATAGVPFLAERLQTPAVMINEGPPLVEVSFVPADLDLSVLSAALLVSLLFTYIINGSGALLLRAFQREAEAGVLEVVITSVTPAQFIGGKLLGLSILVLIQAGLTLLSGLLVYGQNPDGSGPAGLPPEVIPVVVLYLLFGYLAYSGLMLAIASLWPLMAESTQLQFFFRFALLTPLIGAVFILPDADGPLAVVLTMVPIASPLLMPFRVLITAVPTWQIGVSLLLLLLWAWFLLWLSTRLFRAHGLLTGRTPMLRAVWWALAGR
jgi:ABC-2 type transport system permease protein